MAKPSDELIDELIITIDNAVNRFDRNVSAIQKQMYAKVLDLISDLDRRVDGTIKVTEKNMRVLVRIKSELNKVIFTKDFKKQVSDLLTAYDKVTSLQQQYFHSISEGFSTTEKYDLLKRAAIESVNDNLSESGLSFNITGKVKDILNQNITGKGNTYSSLVEQMRTFLMNDEKGDGALAKYSKQIVFDALHGYSANYTQLATEDLGLNWFKWVGTLKETSREFCKTLIEAKGECMPYIHRSQLQDIINGHICSHQVELNKKTKLPEGMKPNTTPENFQVLRGGYQCGHQLIPVSSAIVPKTLREQFGN